MPRKLKTYVTSLGFFDQAVAAPSMKAALAAWGAESNLFHQGFAKESNDPEIIAATMAHPGIVLKRPVGSDGPFRDDAALPRHLSEQNVDSRRVRRKHPKRAVRKINGQAGRKDVLAFEKAERQRETEHRKEEAARAKQQERRQRAAAKAEAAFEKARREHEAKVRAIEAERDALERRSQVEQARWKKHREQLHSALRRARERS